MSNVDKDVGGQVFKFDRTNRSLWKNQIKIVLEPWARFNNLRWSIAQIHFGKRKQKERQICERNLYQSQPGEMDHYHECQYNGASQYDYKL